MNDADIRHWIDMKDRLETRAIEIAEEMASSKRSNVDISDATIFWPEKDEENVSVSWTEYGRYQSEWDYSESFPLKWLTMDDDDWYKEYRDRERVKAAAKERKERQAEEEKERKEAKERKAQYLELKEEFENEDV